MLPPPPLHAPVGAAGGAMLPAPSTPVATRLFADPRFRVPDDFGAVAVLIFPDAAARSGGRGLMVCRAFVGVLASSSAIAAEQPDWEQMVTLWPVALGSAALDPHNQNVSGAQAATSVCPVAAADYDDVAAAAWRARLPTNVDLGSGPGPFLIAWAPAQKAGQPHVPILVYDLGAFATPTALTTAFRIWAGEIEGNPQAWAGGWNLTRFRLKAAAEVDAFGGEIEAAMKLVPWLGDH